MFFEKFLNEYEQHLLLRNILHSQHHTAAFMAARKGIKIKGIQVANKKSAKRH